MKKLYLTLMALIMVSAVLDIIFSIFSFVSIIFNSINNKNPLLKKGVFHKTLYYSAATSAFAAAFASSSAFLAASNLACAFLEIFSTSFFW